MKRACWASIFFALWVCSTMTGCALVESVLGPLFGTTPQTADDPPVKHIINFLQTIPGIGTAIASGLGIGRWGWVEYKRAQLLKEGKKDDNYNGVDDALEKPPAAPTA